MTQFFVGCVVGGLVFSVLWLLYIAYFFDEAAGLGSRFRRWVRNKTKR